MEITNEIKAKVFAQYLGQQFINGAKQVDTMRSIDGEDFRINRLGHNGKLCKLVLRPLSDIKDFEVIEVGIIRAPKVATVSSVEMIKQYLIKHGCYDDFEVYQFLQSRGFDLPHYLLGGKTLKEAGLAVYQIGDTIQ